MACPILPPAAAPTSAGNGREHDPDHRADRGTGPSAVLGRLLVLHTDEPALESAMTRASGLWHGDRDQFRGVMLNEMCADRSWARAGREYVNVYEDVRHNDAAGVPTKLDEMRPGDAVDWGPGRARKPRCASRRGHEDMKGLFVDHCGAESICGLEV